MAEPRPLEAYQFYDRNWESLSEAREDFEWELPERFNMAAYVCDRWAEAEESRDAIYAVDASDTEHCYTFADIDDAARRLGQFLRERGIERGDRVGVSGSQKPETIISHVAAWKIGAVSVPLSVLLGPEGLKHRMADSGVSAVVGYETNIDPIRTVADDISALETILTDGVVSPGPSEHDFWSTISSHDPRVETVDTAAEDNAIIFYTSGTTGKPKGVVHPHRTLLGVLPSVLATHDMVVNENEVYRTVVELSWVGSVMDVTLPALYYGIPVVQHDREEFEPAKEFELIDRYDITVMWIPPTAIRMMMQEEEGPETYETSSLRVIGSGGESLGDSIVDWAEDVFDGANVHEGYGQTEAPTCIGDATALDVEHRPGKMGKAAPGYEIAVLDPETAEPIEEPNQVGELGLRADLPVCMKEYWNQPEKTEAKFENGWLLGEDLISIDGEGYASFESRKDEVIISSGYRLGPAEIEDAVASHEAVVNAGVIGVPHETRGEIPKAFVSLADNNEPSAGLKKEIQQFVKDRLAKYEYPREIEFVESLPKTTTGKIQRRQLQERG